MAILRSRTTTANKAVEPKTAVLSKQSALVALTKRKRSMIESTN